MATPIKGQAYDFFVSLVEQANPEAFVIDPTIAAGDVLVSQDGGANANITSLPAASPAGSSNVLVQLSAAEMAFDKVVVAFSDLVGAQWQELTAFLDNPSGNDESVYDLMVGDHTETAVKAIIKRAGTETILMEKDVSGSPLSPSITITTVDS